MAAHVLPAFVLTVRRHTADDALETLGVFQDVLCRRIARGCGEARQQAGGPGVVEAGMWGARLTSTPTWVAELRGQIVGLLGLASGGEVDMLHVHPEHMRCGIGKALLDEVELAAREADVYRLHARVSRAAEPLFRRQGFVRVREQGVGLNVERLTDVVMEKLLEPCL